MRNKTPHVFIVSCLDAIAHIGEGGTGAVHRIYSAVDPPGQAAPLHEASLAFSALAFWICVAHVFFLIWRALRSTLGGFLACYELAAQITDKLLLKSSAAIVRTLKRILGWLDADEAESKSPEAKC